QKPRNELREAHAGTLLVPTAFPRPAEKGGGRTRRRTALSLRATGCEVHPLRPAASGSKAPRASGIRRNGTTQRGTSRCARRDLHRNAAAGYSLRASDPGEVAGIPPRRRPPPPPQHGG